MRDVITVSGQPGSGTTTVAKQLANKFNGTYVNGGDIFRALADEHGMSLDEFSKHVNENPAIDREIDHQLRTTIESYLGIESETNSATGERQSDLDISIDINMDAPVLVLESRLAGWIAGTDASFRLWCQAPIDIRCDRIDTEHSREEHAEELVQRQTDEAMRYDQWYDIDISDTTIYDLVVNTSRWSEGTTLELITTAIRRYVDEEDEGKTPTESPFTS